MPTFYNIDPKADTASQSANNGLYSFPPRDKNRQERTEPTVERLPRPGQNLFKEEVPVPVSTSSYSLTKDDSVMVGRSHVAAEPLPQRRRVAEAVETERPGTHQALTDLTDQLRALTSQVEEQFEAIGQLEAQVRERDQVLRQQHEDLGDLRQMLMTLRPDIEALQQATKVLAETPRIVPQPVAEVAPVVAAPAVEVEAAPLPVTTLPIAAAPTTAVSGSAAALNRLMATAPITQPAQLAVLMFDDALQALLVEFSKLFNRVDPQHRQSAGPLGVIEQELSLHQFQMRDLLQTRYRHYCKTMDADAAATQVRADLEQMIAVTAAMMPAHQVTQLRAELGHPTPVSATPQNSAEVSKKAKTEDAAKKGLFKRVLTYAW